MSTTEVPRREPGDVTGGGSIGSKLEAVVIPVSDVDRAKEFYARLRWRLDADLGNDTFRVVQFNPPGSDCSIQFGIGLTAAAPGSAQSLLVVSDIEAAHDDLAAKGAEPSEVFHDSSGGYNRWDTSSRASGPDPDRRTYASFLEFTDPDGNLWQLQEITSRLPGRVDATAATFNSADELRRALERAAAAHGEHEKTLGQADEHWPEWYAAYMLAEQLGDELPS
jgi:catechol 2,3-dioxygenase-like lactoylglutathione lyase family enzyme